MNKNKNGEVLELEKDKLFIRSIFTD